MKLAGRRYASPFVPFAVHGGGVREDGAPPSFLYFTDIVTRGGSAEAVSSRSGSELEFI